MAIALTTSLPRRMPLSSRTTPRPATASTTGSRAAMLDRTPSSWQPPSGSPRNLLGRERARLRHHADDAEALVGPRDGEVPVRVEVPLGAERGGHHGDPQV